VKIGGGGCCHLSVLGFGHNPGSVREVMSKASVSCGVGTIPSVQAMELSYQLLQFLVFTFAQVVLESNSLGFDFLGRSVWSFTFFLGVI